MRTTFPHLHIFARRRYTNCALAFTCFARACLQLTPCRFLLPTFGFVVVVRAHARLYAPCAHYTFKLTTRTAAVPPDYTDGWLRYWLVYATDVTPAFTRTRRVAPCRFGATLHHTGRWWCRTFCPHGWDTLRLPSCLPRCYLPPPVAPHAAIRCGYARTFYATNNGRRDAFRCYLTHVQHRTFTPCRFCVRACLRSRMLWTTFAVAIADTAMRRHTAVPLPHALPAHAFRPSLVGCGRTHSCADLHIKRRVPHFGSGCVGRRSGRYCYAARFGYAPAPRRGWLPRHQLPGLDTIRSPVSRWLPHRLRVFRLVAPHARA